MDQRSVIPELANSGSSPAEPDYQLID